jgi:hypothetical protein
VSDVREVAECIFSRIQKRTAHTHRHFRQGPRESVPASGIQIWSTSALSHRAWQPRSSMLHTATRYYRLVLTLTEMTVVIHQRSHSVTGSISFTALSILGVQSTKLPTQHKPSCSCSNGLNCGLSRDPKLILNFACG